MCIWRIPKAFPLVLFLKKKNVWTDRNVILEVANMGKNPEINQVCSWPCWANAVTSSWALWMPHFADEVWNLMFSYSLLLCEKRTFWKAEPFDEPLILQSVRVVTDAFRHEFWNGLEFWQASNPTFREFPEFQLNNYVIFEISECNCFVTNSKQGSSVMNMS